MGYNIKFSVHRNPQKDADGNDTYQVRHETNATVSQKYMLDQLERHNIIRPELMEQALSVLKREIVAELTDNHRLHLEGLGTFFLKLGFRKRYDEAGEEMKVSFTDPSKITGNDVTIESIGFTPDKDFLKQLNKHGYHFINATGRGNVGHSADYTEEQVKAKLDEYFKTHDYITCRIMQGYFGLTKYMARKWLDQLCTQPAPYLVGRKIGQTVTYRRR
jgi:nucleoid DNA-binding protein